jgi:hypothetical protein
MPGVAPQTVAVRDPVLGGISGAFRPRPGTRGAEWIACYRTFAESGALYRVNENDWPLV